MRSLSNKIKMTQSQDFLAIDSEPVKKKNK